MRIPGAAISFVGLLVLSGCGAAVKGCARVAVEHVPAVAEHTPVVKVPVEFKVPPAMHDTNIHPSEAATNTIRLNPDADIRQDPDHSETHSFSHKALEEIVREGGKHAFEAAGKNSDSNSDSGSKKK